MTEETRIVKILWCEVYAAVIASEKESSETAVLQANEAVNRYREAWDVRYLPAPRVKEAP